MKSLITFFLLSSTLFAQIPSKDKRLELSALIKEAIENNAQLKSRHHQTQAIKAQIGPAGTYDDPKISYSFSNYPTDSYASDEYIMTGRELSLEQKINFPGKLSKKKNAAEFRFKAAKFNYADQKLSLIFNVKKAYYTLYLVHEKIKITQENINTLKQFSKLVNSSYKTGKGHQTDTIKINLRLTELNLSLISLQNELKIREADINILLNREAHLALDRPIIDKDQALALYKKLDMKNIYQVALTNNPKMNQRINEVKSAQQEKEFSTLNYLPDITFGVKYRTRDATNNEPTGQDFASASVGITLPLFFWSKQNEQHNEAIHKKYAAEAQKLYTQKELGHHIHQMILNVEEMHSFLKTYTQVILPQTEQALKGSRAGYRVGVIDFLTLIDSEKQHFTNRIAHEKTLVGYLSAMALLERSVGAPFQSSSK